MKLRCLGLGALLATAILAGCMTGGAHAVGGEIDLPGDGSSYPADPLIDDELDCWLQYWHPFCQYHAE
jgi:hypothetical protein